MIEDTVIIGRGLRSGYEEPFGLTAADRRQHLYVIGKSGTGKSTLLRNLILQDIEAGRGVGIIDPHGDLASDILDHIPRRRVEDVVHFDPSDTDYPVSFNPLAQVPPRDRPRVASNMVASLKGIWGSVSWGPRMEYLLYAALRAVMDCENESLFGVQRMLSDAGYRARVVERCQDIAVRFFWTVEFTKWDRATVAEAVSPLQNKIGQVLMSPALRNVLCQSKSRIGARFMMDNGKIFVANLSKGRLGEDKSAIIGALLAAEFQSAAMSRVDVPEEGRRDFHLYVDEFQSFVSSAFVSILSEARKYRLCLTLAHQYLGQLQEGILAAVIGNVASIISFRVGHTEAEALEMAFGKSYAAEHFTNLNNREVYAKILSNGRDSAPFFGRMLPPMEARHGRRDRIIKRSRERYSVRLGAIEAKLARWLKRYQI